MKKFKNILILLFSVLLFGCSNLIENEENLANGSAKVILQLEENDSRTVFESKGSCSDFKNLKFYAKGPSDSEQKLLSSWDTYFDFYKTTREYSFDEGSYTFKFCAERNGVLFSQILTETISSSSTTILKFTEMEVDSENTGKNGSVYVNVTFPSSIYEKTKKITAKFGSEDEKELEMIGGEESNWSTSSYTYYYKAIFKSDSVEEGNYLLTFKCYDENEKVIFTYPTYVFVKAGYTSSSYETLKSPDSVKSSSESAYKITYNSNYENDSVTFEQNFYKGSAILNASQAGFSVEGKKLKCWNTQKDGKGTKYQVDSQISLSENLTLYAIWVSENSFDVTYYLNPDDATEAKTFVDEDVSSGSQNLKNLSDVGFTTLSGKKFMGWDTNQDGSGNRYDSGASFTLSGETKFYAQWCTYSSEDSVYSIGSNREFNAFFNAPENQTEIKLNAKLTADLTEPNFNLTKNKTLSATFSGGHIINLAKSKNCSNLFKTISSSGKIESLCIWGKYASYSIASYVNGDGIFAEENNGSILGCSIWNVVLVPTGSENAGGFAGKNNGTISNCQIETLKISPSSSVKYAGGIAGYNTGTITKDNVLSESSVSFYNKNYLNYYGQILGYNEGGTVSSEMTADVSTLKDNVSYTVNSNTTSTVYTLELDETSFVTLSVTDNSGGGAIYANLYDSDSKSKISSGKVNGTTFTNTVLLTKGTYTLKLRNENVLSSSVGKYSISTK